MCLAQRSVTKGRRFLRRAKTIGGNRQCLHIFSERESEGTSQDEIVDEEDKVSCLIFQAQRLTLLCVSEARKREQFLRESTSMFRDSLNK